MVERARDARWRGAAEVLALACREPGITRAEAARRLGLSTGSATEITARLRELGLLIEAPAPIGGRGRPTTALHPDPGGPVVLVLELREKDWRCAAATLDGRLEHLSAASHAGHDPSELLGVLEQTVTRARRRFGRRLAVVSVAVAATVSEGRPVSGTTFGWTASELNRVSGDLPLLLGNDATLGGVAEARTGRAVTADTALHLLVEGGIGGALIVGGRPLTGTAGAGGEYGHVPFADRGLRCPCGARGCWELDVNAHALARHLGEPSPAEPRSYVVRILRRTDPAAKRAVETVVEALASGIAGLVNAHDPDMVTLGGLAAPLRGAAPAAFHAAYLDGLMSYRRTAPPPVLDALHGEDGSLLGAAAVGVDHLTTSRSLADWAQLRR